MPARYSSRSLSLTTEDYPHHHYARGTREALIHHGITRDGPFPGDPGEKKTICNTTDPQGRPIFMRRASKTNTQLDKADHLKREGLPKRELELLLSVLYLEANGPENRGGAEPDLLHEFPPFDPSMAMIPPALVDRAVALFDGFGVNWRAGARHVPRRGDQASKQAYAGLSRRGMERDNANIGIPIQSSDIPPTPATRSGFLVHDCPAALSLI